MISDVLADAVENVREYRRSYPVAYANLAQEIDNTVAVMDGLRTVLDAAPGILEAEVEQIRAALRSLDVSPITTAKDHLVKVATAIREAPDDGGVVQ